MLSIVIPTYNEGDNIVAIVDEIDNVLKEKEYEIIFVDDSTDCTIEKLEFISKEKKQVRYIHRKLEKGLATAVVKGFDEARGNIVAVMDCDLQHPPKILIAMLYAIEKKNADIVIPSRFINGGNDGGLNFLRKLISYTARSLGNIFIRKLRAFSDNTSGYFMLKKDVIKNCNLNPIGWKILIEVLVKGKYNNVVEIPYEFKARSIGESKMSIKQQINYIRHILRILKGSPEDLQFIYFCMVGFSGVMVNMIIYYALASIGIGLVISAFFSALAAMISNFILNDSITWKERKKGKVHERIIKNFITSAIGIGINIFVLNILLKDTYVNYMLANILGILCSVIWNYSINNIWTWKAEVADSTNNVKVVRWKISEVSKVMQLDYKNNK